jgi:hypothetical protein
MRKTLLVFALCLPVVAADTVIIKQKSGLDFSLSKATPYSQLSDNFSRGANRGASLRQGLAERKERKKREKREKIIAQAQRNHTVYIPGEGVFLDEKGYYAELFAIDPLIALEESEKRK